VKNRQKIHQKILSPTLVKISSLDHSPNFSFPKKYHQKRWKIYPPIFSFPKKIHQKRWKFYRKFIRKWKWAHTSQIHISYPISKFPTKFHTLTIWPNSQFKFHNVFQQSLSFNKAFLSIKPFFQSAFLCPQGSFAILAMFFYFEVICRCNDKSQYPLPCLQSRPQAPRSSLEFLSRWSTACFCHTWATKIYLTIHKWEFWIKQGFVSYHSCCICLFVLFVIASLFLSYMTTQIIILE